MFIFSPSEAEKQPRVQKIVFVTGKMTNVMEYITFFDFAAYTTTVRPRDTRPQAARTSQVHIF